MAGLFDAMENKEAERYRPLAERMRPKRLAEVVGQEHLLSDGAPIAAFVKSKRIPSMVLWGPPGTGKTTLARCIASEANMEFVGLSAIESGVRELRALIGKAQRDLLDGRRTLVFVDEIHRYNKAQQDALLHAVEHGDIVVIGATTENPSFEINSALKSRCQAYRLHSLADSAIKELVRKALSTDVQLQAFNIASVNTAALVRISGGDARIALNALESAAQLAVPNTDGYRDITLEVLTAAVQKQVVNYDKNGEAHYDTISAFIKSVRGSDPDASLLYLARMIDAGEDALFIARRLVVLASEDVGNADPTALPLAVAGFEAIERIGMPEGRIILGQVTTYLASAPKSNASYTAIDRAFAEVRAAPSFTIPMHLRNAPNAFMENQGNGNGYEYPHNHPNNVVKQDYFPPEISPSKLYDPTDQGCEKTIKERLTLFWPGREKKPGMD